MKNSVQLCAHSRPLARGKAIPKALRRSINQFAHNVAVSQEQELRRQLLDRAQQMLADGLIVDDIAEALGLSNGAPTS